MTEYPIKKDKNNTISLENILPKTVKIANRDEFILSYCKGKKVLHLGAVDSKFLEDKIKKGQLFHLKLMSAGTKEVVGIDIDRDGVKTLHRYGINNVIYGNVEKLDELDLKGDFDLIIAGEIIEHLNNPGLFLEGIKRFFHKDTEMILTTPNAFSYIRFYHILLNKEIVHPDHKCWYSYVTLRNLLGDSGFEVCKAALYSYRKAESINSLHPRTLLNRSILLRKIFYRINSFFADGLIFVVKLRKQT